MGDARLGRDDTDRGRWWGMDEREFQMRKAVMGYGRDYSEWQYGPPWAGMSNLSIPPSAVTKQNLQREVDWPAHFKRCLG